MRSKISTFGITSYSPNPGDLGTETVGEDGETEAADQYEIYREMLNGKDADTFEAEVMQKFIEQPDQMKTRTVWRRRLASL